MKGLLFCLLFVFGQLGAYSQAPDTIPLYDVGCASWNPWLIDTSYHYLVQDTLYITRVSRGNCCQDGLVGLLYGTADSIRVAVTDTSTNEVSCLCDCSFGYTFRIPVNADSVYLFWQGEYIIVHQDITSIHESVREKPDEMLFYPNPASDLVTFSVKSFVSIHSLEGKLVYISNGRKKNVSLNDIGLNQGTYVVTVYSEHESSRRILVKQ